LKLITDEKEKKKMVKKAGILMMAVIMVAVMSAAAFAAEKLNGKVSGVSGDKVTVVLEGAVPAWVKAGATVKAGSAAPKIVSVKGNEVVLRFSKSKAAKIKADSAMSLEESEGEELQGC
jgi:sRNA-binding carbon storage regulator CsrA